MSPTAVLGLPYPNGDARPCDFDEDWCQFTTAVQGYFDLWRSGLRRAYPAIPAALMYLMEPYDLVPDSSIRFDTLRFDTAAMTDMDADPYTITIKKRGRYSVSAFVLMINSTGDDQVILSVVDITTGGTTVTSDQLIDNGHHVRIQTETQVVSLVEGTQLRVGIFQSGSVPRQIREASICAYWHSDAETP